MSSSIQLTLCELSDAFAWAKNHVQIVHANSLPNADLKIMKIPSTGIGDRTVILCEACDRIHVTNANHQDVTDYSCW